MATFNPFRLFKQWVPCQQAQMPHWEEVLSSSEQPQASDAKYIMFPEHLVPVELPGCLKAFKPVGRLNSKEVVEGKLRNAFNILVKNAAIHGLYLAQAGVLVQVFGPSIGKKSCNSVLL